MKSSPTRTTLSDSIHWTPTWVSEDGGSSFQRLSADHRHSDDHALWIDPDFTDHL